MTYSSRYDNELSSTDNPFTRNHKEEIKDMQPSNVKKGRIFLGKTIRQADSKSRIDTIN